MDTPFYYVRQVSASIWHITAEWRHEADRAAFEGAGTGAFRGFREFMGLTLIDALMARRNGDRYEVTTVRSLEHVHAFFAERGYQLGVAAA